MAACDVLVILRSPTMGETSGTAIRALSLGKPLVVSDVGWFAELPDDVALKVPVDEREVAALAAALELLADAARRARGDGRGRARLVEREHALDARRRRATPPRSRRRPAATPCRRGAPRGRARRRPRSGSSRRSAEARASSRAGSPRSTLGGVTRRCRARAGVGLARRLVVALGRSCGSRSRARIVAPWIMVDELIYSELAKSFAATGTSSSATRRRRLRRSSIRC